MVERGQVIISGAKTMATSLEQLLAGSYGGTDSYLKKSPWAQAGAQIMQIEAPVAQTNAQAFSIPFIQGLLGGGLMGYGKKQATQQAFEDYSKNPLLKGTYASGEMPEGWSADTGRADLLQGLVRAEAERKAEAEKAKQQAKIEALLMQQGGMLSKDAEGRTAIVRIPGLGKIQAELAGEKARAAKQAELMAEADSLGYSPKKEEETDKLRKEFSSLPEVKNYSLVSRTGDAMAKALRDKSGTTDLELSRYGILLIEPGMAVREGEQAGVMNSGSIPEAWKGYIVKSLDGKSGLPDNVREGLRNLALRAYESNKSKYDQTLTFYKKQASIRGLDPERISYLGEAETADSIGLGRPLSEPWTPRSSQTGGGVQKLKASDLIAQGYKKTADGWVK